MLAYPLLLRLVPFQLVLRCAVNFFRPRLLVLALPLLFRGNPCALRLAIGIRLLALRLPLRHAAHTYRLRRRCHLRRRLRRRLW